MMPPYPILCYRQGCGRPAEYKLAARWSDGITGELKTYSLCCKECLPESFRESKRRQAQCRTAPVATRIEKGYKGGQHTVADPAQCKADPVWRYPPHHVAKR